MERNKSIDGLRTRADKNPKSSNIDGLKSRSALPVFKTASSTKVAPVHTAKKPVVKAKKVSPAPTKPRTVKASLVPTKDEDLLAAFSDDNQTQDTKTRLSNVSASFIEPSVDIYEDTLEETIQNEDNDEVFVPDIVSKDEKTMSKKELKAKKKEAKEQKDPSAQKEKKQKKPVSKVRKIITTIILILVLGALTNILAFGTSGWDMKGDVGGGIHDGAQLTDSIMAISINQETGDVAMMSLPRDLKASPTCTATGKINEVYWCHNMYGDKEEEGAQALMKEVGGILGIDFQYFVHINWGSLVTIVDTLGGIKVTLDEDIKDYGGTRAVFDAGVEYTINGEQALGLARARHGTTDGDFSRGNSQQKILVGIKDRVYEKDISLTDTLTLVGSLGDNLRTNLSVSEIKTAIHLSFLFDFDVMRQLPLMDHENHKYYMSYAYINNISYVVPAAGVGNYNQIREYVRVNLNNDPVVREQARVLILNGSDAVGVAATERDALRTEEYNVVNIDNIGGNWPEKHYIFFTDKKFNGTVEALEKRYNTVAEERFPEGIDTEKYDIVVIIGGEREAPVEEAAE